MVLGESDANGIRQIGHFRSTYFQLLISHSNANKTWWGYAAGESRLQRQMVVCPKAFSR
jgi:hypothetical protein